MTSEVYIRIPEFLSSILIEINPSYENYKTRNNGIIVKLDKTLYGCIESAKLWFLDISNYLMEISFKPTTLDQCILIKEDEDNTIYYQY